MHPAGRLLSILLVAIRAVSPALAQQDLCKENNAGGGFTIQPAERCAPLTVGVVQTNPLANNVFYVFDYKPGLDISKVDRTKTAHTYDKAGTYTILQGGSANSQGFYSCQTITVRQARKPNVRIDVCQNYKVTLTIVRDSISEAYDKFLINWGDGKEETVQKANLRPVSHQYDSPLDRYVTVRPLYNSNDCVPPFFPPEIISVTSATRPVVTELRSSKTTGDVTLRVNATTPVVVEQKNADGTFTVRTHQSLSGGRLQVSGVSALAAGPVCFRVRTQNACGELQYSDEVCTIDLQVAAVNKQMDLTWITQVDANRFQQFRVIRADMNTPRFNLASPTVRQASDNQGLVCQEDYCYRVEAQYNNGTVVSSEEVCRIAINTDKPLPYVSVLATVEDERARIIALPDPAVGGSNSSMVVWRSDSPNGNYQPLAEAWGTAFTDSTARPNERSYCYQVAYKNACGVSSDFSDRVCTIHLSQDAPEILRWTSPTPFAGEEPNRYILQNPTVGGGQDMGTQIRYVLTGDQVDQQQLSFRIVGSTATGLTSNSNLLTVVRPVRLYVPDAFTPNGDGTNDRFEIKGGQFLESFQLLIYNRWGEGIFRTAEREGWDGTLNGQPAAAGQYTYRIEGRDQLGNRVVKSGLFWLIR